jgi:hypothetical protein
MGSNRCETDEFDLDRQDECRSDHLVSPAVAGDAIAGRVSPDEVHHPVLYPTGGVKSPMEELKVLRVAVLIELP